MSPRRQRFFSLETLEVRHALAGDVMAVMYGQMLVVWGDAEANGAVLTYDSTTLSYHVTGQDAGGSPTTINGQTEAVLSGVQSVAVLLNGGDDTFSVGSPEAVDVVISQWLSIDMGDGNDNVQLGQGGNAPGGDDPTALHLRTGTSIVIDLGSGDDHLELANAEIGWVLNIAAGEGNDEVDFATEFTPDGATNPVLFPVLVRGGVNINLGGGEDELTIHNAIFQQQLQILDGAGAAHIDLHNLNIARKLDIDTASDGDQIDIDFVQARDLTIDSNNGIDDVDFTNCRFRSLIVKLGSQRDALLLRNVRVTLLTRLDGGENGSRLAGSSNMLRGLTRRNIG
jgi:hypothetical protein